MRNDDQWFEPGDKVMRVEYAETLGLINNGITPPETEFGRVLCVTHCTDIPRFGNVVRFVGIEDGLGFYACCFRKVSEIQLCVRAARHLSNPVEKVQTV